MYVVLNHGRHEYGDSRRTYHKNRDDEADGDIVTFSMQNVYTFNLMGDADKISINSWHRVALIEMSVVAQRFVNCFGLDFLRSGEWEADDVERVEFGVCLFTQRYDFIEHPGIEVVHVWRGR